jgi:hypothetical protein
MCQSCLAYDLLKRQVDETSVTDVVEDFLDEIDETLSGAWTRESDKAIDKSVKAMKNSSDTTTGLLAMLAVLRRSLKKVTNKADEKRLTVLVDGLYRTAKEAETTKLGGTFAMSSLDTALVDTLAADGPYWINEFYGEHLSARISEVGRKATIETGLGRKAAGDVMRKTLEKEFRLLGGPSPFISSVPARFAGNVGNYTRIVAANVTQRNRVYSSISAYQTSGIQEYIISAVMDERTTEVCQEMNGRKFFVNEGVSQLNRIAATETPEEFIEMAPWPSNVEEVRATAGTGTLEQQNRNLASGGLALPPYHGMCRTVVEALA